MDICYSWQLNFQISFLYWGNPKIEERQGPASPYKHQRALSRSLKSTCDLGLIYLIYYPGAVLWDGKARCKDNQIICHTGSSRSEVNFQENKGEVYSPSKSSSVKVSFADYAYDRIFPGFASLDSHLFFKPLSPKFLWILCEILPTKKKYFLLLS